MNYARPLLAVRSPCSCAAGVNRTPDAMLFQRVDYIIAPFLFRKGRQTLPVSRQAKQYSPKG